MPYMINNHGTAVCVNADDVDVNLQRGLRLATDEDWNYLQSDTATFCIHEISGIERGWLGERPVHVIGMGPSRSAVVPDAWRLGVNSRGDVTDLHGMVAIDDCYWDAHGAQWDGIHRFYPRGTQGPRNGGTWYVPPLHPLKGRGWSNSMAVKIGQAVARAHYSSIAATLLALYLTDGPVVISGVDLSGADEMGVPYANVDAHEGISTQENAWEAASKVLEGRVFIHRDMTGPLVFMFPRYEV